MVHFKLSVRKIFYSKETCIKIVWKVLRGGGSEACNKPASKRR